MRSSTSIKTFMNSFKNIFAEKRIDSKKRTKNLVSSGECWIKLAHSPAAMPARNGSFLGGGAIFTNTIPTSPSHLPILACLPKRAFGAEKEEW